MNLNSFLSLYLISSLILSTASAQDLSQERSLSHPATLELALQDYYKAARGDFNLQQFQSPAHDLQIWSDALASEIALFNPKLFNNIIVLLAIDYCQIPQIKSSIEILARSIRSKAEHDINPPHWAHTVVQDALWVWGLSLGFFTAKSSIQKWRQAGAEVTLLRRSWGRLKALFTGYPDHLVKHWVLPPIAGSAIGLAHAFINTFRTHKLDPLQVLADIRCNEELQTIEFPVIAGHPRDEGVVLKELGIDPSQRESLQRLRFEMIQSARDPLSPPSTNHNENNPLDEYEAALLKLIGNDSVSEEKSEVQIQDPKPGYRRTVPSPKATEKKQYRNTVQAGH